MCHVVRDASRRAHATHGLSPLRRAKHTPSVVLGLHTNWARATTTVWALRLFAADTPLHILAWRLDLVALPDDRRQQRTNRGSFQQPVCAVCVGRASGDRGSGSGLYGMPANSPIAGACSRPAAEPYQRSLENMVNRYECCVQVRGHWTSTDVLCTALLGRVPTSRSRNSMKVFSPRHRKEENMCFITMAFSAFKAGGKQRKLRMCHQALQRTSLNTVPRRRTQLVQCSDLHPVQLRRRGSWLPASLRTLPRLPGLERTDTDVEKDTPRRLGTAHALQ